MQMTLKTGNKLLDMFITILIALFGLLLVVGLIKAIIQTSFPPKVEPTDLSFMRRTYNGLPFAFWFFVSFGIMFGLTFHGFKIVHVESHNKGTQVVQEKKNVK